MTVLVDAKVLSEATKPSPDPDAIAWLRDNAPEVCPAGDQEHRLWGKKPNNLLAARAGGIF